MSLTYLKRWTEVVSGFITPTPVLVSQYCSVQVGMGCTIIWVALRQTSHHRFASFEWTLEVAGILRLTVSTTMA